MEKETSLFLFSRDELVRSSDFVELWRPHPVCTKRSAFFQKYSWVRRTASGRWKTWNSRNTDRPFCQTETIQTGCFKDKKIQLVAGMWRGGASTSRRFRNVRWRKEACGGDIGEGVMKEEWLRSFVALFFPPDVSYCFCCSSSSWCCWRLARSAVVVCKSWLPDPSAAMFQSSILGVTFWLVVIFICRFMTYIYISRVLICLFILPRCLKPFWVCLSLWFSFHSNSRQEVIAAGVFNIFGCFLLSPMLVMKLIRLVRSVWFLEKKNIAALGRLLLF